MYKTNASDGYRKEMVGPQKKKPELQNEIHIRLLHKQTDSEADWTEMERSDVTGASFEAAVMMLFLISDIWVRMET